MSFNPLSLDYIYYPVSAIMWVWYKLFAFVLGPTNFFAWALSVVFLVFTLRAILYRPFVRQIETTRQMQELQPQIKALQKKYGKDRQRMALEMQKLQKEHGFNPILGCLPMLAQVPVFLGLFHVLRSFNRTGNNFGELGLDPMLNRELPNYVFSAADVQHFLQANFFGAPLGANMIQSQSSWAAFIDFEPSRMAIIGVGVPLMIVAGIATHFNSRASVARQSPEAAANPQTAMMNKLALYVFPLGVVVGGPFLPLAIILYWVANNVWTYFQQLYVFGKIEKREEQQKEEELARRAANAPAPGKKPARKPKPGAKPVTPAADETAAADVEQTAVDPSQDANEAKDTTGGSASASTEPKPKAPNRANGNRATTAKVPPRRNPNRGKRKP